MLEFQVKSRCFPCTVANVLRDPESSVLVDAEKALLRFVHKVIASVGARQQVKDDVQQETRQDQPAAAAG